MNTVLLSEQDLLRQAIIEVASLPKQDLATVLELVQELKQKPQSSIDEKKRIAAKLLSQARKRADDLRGLPRLEIATRLQEVMHEIHQEALAKSLVYNIFKYMCSNNQCG